MTQKEFIKHYEKLKSNLNDDEVILFINAVQPTQNTKISCGWIKGCTKLNIACAVNLTDIANCIFDKFATVNQEPIVQFLANIHKA